MSQQEFMPESQDNEEPQKQSYSQYRTSDMPKRDHPSDYSGSIPAYSYQAQDATSSKQQQTQADQISNSQQRGQSSARQPAGKQQQTSSTTARKQQETFTQQGQSFFQNQSWNRQSAMPPYMGTQRKTAPNWFAILVIVCVVLFVVPLLLRLLFALFIVLFVMGLFLMLIVGILILIYIFYFKKRLQRSRWWPW
jgi:Flp pilus assembly protein TadB